MQRNDSFWNMPVEEAMGQNEQLFDMGCITPACGSDTPNSPYRDNCAYSRDSIAQLSLHEPSAEALIQNHQSKGVL